VAGWRGFYCLRVLAGGLIDLQVISISAFDVAPEYGNFKPSVLKVMLLLLLMMMMMGLLLLLLLLQSLITPPPSALRSPSPKPPAATTSTSTPNGPL